jgi:hypothetical protein
MAGVRLLEREIRTPFLGESWLSREPRGDFIEIDLKKAALSKTSLDRSVYGRV